MFSLFAVSSKIIMTIDERDKIVFHNTTQNLQDQDRFFWSQTGLVLRPTVSDHITVKVGTLKLT